VASAGVVGREVVVAGSADEVVAAAGTPGERIVTRAADEAIAAGLARKQHVGRRSAVEEVVAGTAIALDAGRDGDAPADVERVVAGATPEQHVAELRPGLRTDDGAAAARAAHAGGCTGADDVDRAAALGDGEVV
jgi:hypothetical protein